MQTPYDVPVLLHGWLVDAHGKASKGYLLLQNGYITHNGVGLPESLPNDVVSIELGDDEVVFPGLLDLHSHVNYNMIGLWDYSSTGIDCWDNRFEWRANSDYHENIEELNGYIRSNWKPPFAESDTPRNLPCWMYSELQAIAGGTTVLQETEYLTSDDCYENEHVLVRSTGVPTDLNLSPDEMIDTAVDFYEASDPKGDIQGTAPQDTSDWTSRENDNCKDYFNAIENGASDKIKGALVHLAEGRSGFLRPHDQEVDAYTLKEFHTFRDDCLSPEIPPEVMKKTHMTLIHGCGIDEHNPVSIKFLQDYGVSVLWSPVSNLLLYKDTLCIFPLLMNGIDVALGSDWSPSGSKNVWGEAKFAKFFLETIGVPKETVDPAVYAMVTTNAAKTINVNQYAGTLQVGAFADCFILRSPNGESITADNALEVFFQTSDANVRCVTIAGRPIYGDEDIFQQFPSLNYQQMPKDEGPYAAGKVVHYPDELGVELEASIESLDEIMESQGAERSKFLVSDDEPYQQCLQNLKDWLEKNYKDYLYRDHVQGKFASVLTKQ